MSDQPGSLAEALTALQAKLPRITKDSEAQAGNRKITYANLATITETVFPLLHACGLLWTCWPDMEDGQFVLRYRLEVVAGESREGSYPLPSGNPQTMGGAITYARRYALCAVLGIAPAEDDDDAQAATADWHAPASPRSRKADRHRADRSGPLPDDQWSTAPGPPPEQRPGSITPDQLRGLHAAYTRVKVTERDDKLALAMSLLDLPALGSSKELSQVQAAELLGKLNDLADGKDG